MSRKGNCYDNAQAESFFSRFKAEMVEGGNLVAEYSTKTPQTTAATRYLTTDHLGSPRIITDATGNVISRRDFMPFGEEIKFGTGSRTEAQGYTFGDTAAQPGDSTTQKFTTYERDDETNLDFAQARMYSSQLGRFTAVDPLLSSAKPADPQSFNRFIYVFNNPLIFVDPTGLLGDYYNRDGEWLFEDDIKNDDKVYVVDEKEETDVDGNKVTNYEATDLGITHTQFQRQASTVYGESSLRGSELDKEMMAIASVHQRNSVAFGVNSTAAKGFRAHNHKTRSGKGKLAVAAVINAVTGGHDYSNGADAWDGAEQSLFPASRTARSVRKNPLNGKRVKWKLHMNTIGWDISNAHYAKWKRNVGKHFKAPRVRRATVGRNKGRSRYVSTAVYNKTIFWRTLP